MRMSGSKWYVKLNKYSSELSVNNILIPRKLINVLTCSQYNLRLYRLQTGVGVYTIYGITTTVTI